MRARRTIGGALAGVAVLAAVSAQAAVAAPTKGVVVNYRAQSTTATISTAGGQLLALHTDRVRPGSKVRVLGTQTLGNGTLAGELKVTGKARRTTVRGVVAARMGRRAIALSGPGTTFVVRLRGTKRSLEVTPQYGVGSTVKVDITIGKDGALDAGKVVVVDDDAPDTLELGGMVTAVGAGTTPATIDPTSGCAVGLRRSTLPQGWIAVSVGDDFLPLTAFVQIPTSAAPSVVPTTTPPSKTNDPTTTTTTTTSPGELPVPPDQPVFVVGQEVEMTVTQALGTDGQACDNQFLVATGSPNGDEEEADCNEWENDDHSWWEDRGHRGRGHDGDGRGRGQGSDGEGDDD